MSKKIALDLQSARSAIPVSFDIDDTLVCGPEVPTEQFVPLWYRRRYAEPIRRGCRELMLTLARRGCPIWIYTTSRRSPRYLRAWFACMGIRLEGVVNLCLHEEAIGYRGPSKYPPAFGIGLHVDDSPGVAMEGHAHGFRVVLVSPHDAHWTERVLEAVDATAEPQPQLMPMPIPMPKPMPRRPALPAYTLPRPAPDGQIRLG